MGVVNSSLKGQTWVADPVGLRKGGETSLILLVLFFCLCLQLVH